MKFSKEDMTSYVAILVIVVSIASIGMTFTGYAAISSKEAVVNVTVETSAAINFTVALVDFGTGSVNMDETGATLETGETPLLGSWTNEPAALSLENIGNVDITLKLYANAAAAAYLGGTDPLFQYNVINKTSNDNACQGAAGAWVNFATTPGAEICDPLSWEDTKDEIDIDIKLYIPVDAAIGTKTATITATGEYTE